MPVLLALCVLFNRFAYGPAGTGMIGVTYDHVEVYALSVLCFILLLGVPAARFPAGLRKGIEWVSRLSFGAYLMSWVSDGFLYPVFVRLAPDYLQRLPWAVPLTVLSLAFALLLAQVVEWIVKPLDRGIRKGLRIS